jgi:hypothetical protein
MRPRLGHVLQQPGEELGDLERLGAGPRASALGPVAHAPAVEVELEALDRARRAE